MRVKFNKMLVSQIQDLPLKPTKYQFRTKSEITNSGRHLGSDMLKFEKPTTEL